jgi:hypothetical protein
MAGLEDVLRRIANDAAWADQVRLTPTEALRGYDLGPDELVRLERALGVHPAEPTKLFEAAQPGAAPQAGMPWRAIVAAVAALGAGLAIGLTGLLGRGGADVTLRPDAASYYGCSDDTAWGAPLGDLHRGDQVWIIGRTGASWAVIRHPDNPGVPAWMPRAALTDYGDLQGLPELTCSTALAAAALVPSAAAPTSASPASATATASSAPPAPTPPRSTAAGSTRTQPIAPAPTTTAPTAAPTTRATPTPTSPATTPKDTTGPALTVTTDSGFLYSEGSSACTAYRQQVTLTVAASDPFGATVTAVTWAAGGKSGAATSLGGGRFRVGPLYSTHSGTIPMTLTVTARDSLGNTSNATRAVDFRQIAEACIG